MAEYNRVQTEVARRGGPLVEFYGDFWKCIAFGVEAPLEGGAATQVAFLTCIANAYCHLLQSIVNDHIPEDEVENAMEAATIRQALQTVIKQRAEAYAMAQVEAHTGSLDARKHSTMRWASSATPASRRRSNSDRDQTVTTQPRLQPNRAGYRRRMAGMRRLFAAAVSAVALVAAAPAPHAAVVVHIRDDAFVPAAVEVAAGTAVTFVNDDDDAHTATADDGSWDPRGSASASVDARVHQAGNVRIFLRAAPLHEGDDRRVPKKLRERRAEPQAFLEHVGWTGAGIAWTLGASGLMTAAASAAPRALTFVQISDSHIGFTRPENPDVAGTLAKTVASINAMPVQPAFVMHTGDLTHLSKPEQFAACKDILATLKAPLFTTPGEHDVIGGPANYAAAFGARDNPAGWHSFDRGGVHFLVLVNVFNFEIDGKLGQEQLDFVKNDLAAQKASTPIVVFGHVPLYALYPAWGWTTEDGATVLGYLQRFDAVTVLNGHIHQVIQHTEGSIHFATAAATAYPQPAPGTADKPGPLKGPPDQLLHVLGYRTVER